MPRRLKTPWWRHGWNVVRLGTLKPWPRYMVEYDMLQPRIEGASLRRYLAEDFAACRELYDLNARNRFPPGGVPDHEAHLKAPGEHTLVVEVGGRVIGCGSVQLIHPDWGVLAYGLVHPKFQGLGVGRLLLFARIAQLPVITTPTRLTICAVRKSLPYYEGYGFTEMAETWEDGFGRKHPMAMLIVNATIIRSARRYLELLGLGGPDLISLAFSGAESQPENGQVAPGESGSREGHSVEDS